MKFYYNSLGTDFGGNYGPCCSDPRWITIEADNASLAILKLPLSEHDKVLNLLEKRGYRYSDLIDFERVVADMAGMGMGFSFMNQVDYDCFKEMCEMDH
jgi:hypothetical protein